MNETEEEWFSFKKPETGDPDLEFVEVPNTEFVRIQASGGLYSPGSQKITSDMTVEDLGIEQDDGQPGDQN